MPAGFNTPFLNIFNLCHLVGRVGGLLLGLAGGYVLYGSCGAISLALIGLFIGDYLG